MKRNDNYLLLGVTGGIASGKTVVAKMLEALGVPLIDFDLLARQVPTIFRQPEEGDIKR